MTIYTVRPGDSVWVISRRFGVTPQSIIEANDLSATPELVNGQSLVIPTKEIAYRVRMGESLWLIAKKFGVSERSIMEKNNITDPYRVEPGQVIRVPQEAKDYGSIEVNGFIQPSTPEKERVVLANPIKYLTYIAPFSYHVNEDGSLSPLADETIIDIAKANNVAGLLSVTNISGDNFSSQVINKILNDPRLQDTVINNIIALLGQKKYYGVVVDFERIPTPDAQKYNNFLRKLVNRLHPQYKVATALAPKVSGVMSGEWHGGHDYRAHGEIVDFVVIMTYEWGWSGGPPMAVAPLNEVRKVINYAVSVIPRNKIMMGVPLYGYDWTLPYVPGGEFAEAIGNQEAIDRAREYGAQIKYDMEAQSPYYNYVDKNRRRHVVWFEDARSVAAKYRLVSREKLRGVSYWSLGKAFPQNWPVLSNMFVIEKV